MAARKKANREFMDSFLLAAMQRLNRLPAEYNIKIMGDILDLVAAGGFLLLYPDMAEVVQYAPPPNLTRALTEGITVEMYQAINLIQGDVLIRLTKFRNKGRIGWSEVGLPGERAEIWCCKQ